jgi:thiol:disulfide interchange protein DsbD
VFLIPGRWTKAVLAGAAVFAAVTLVGALPTSAADEPVVARVRVLPATVAGGDAAAVTVEIEIAEGWHINSSQPGPEFLIPTRLDFELPPGFTAGQTVYPGAVSRRLKVAGNREFNFYEGKILLSTQLRYAPVDDRKGDGPGRPLAVLSYQACSDTLCLRPASMRLALDLEFASAAATTPPRAGPGQDSAGAIARMVGGGLWVVIPGMLLFGLALNLTPCVYPLISVTVAYFGRQAGGSPRRRLVLALAYSLGIAVTFSALGVSAALSGSFFGKALANPMVLVGVAALMVALALSCFGLYQIRVPEVVNSRLGRAAGGVFGSLFMGMTMGVVAAPCVGPVVVGLLMFVGSRGDVGLGLGLFFLLALGLGLPYVVLAMAAGSLDRLPRAGDWLQWTEHLFGCVLLAAALYFVGPLLPDKLSGVAMPVYLALAVLYLAFFDPVGRRHRVFRLLRAVAGTAALAAIAVVYIPQSGSHGALSWQPFSDEARAAAKASGRPFVIEFGADWCLPCKEMEERTFTDPAVLGQAQGVLFIEVDMTTSTGYTDLVLKRFDVLGAPTTLFFDSDGKEADSRDGASTFNPGVLQSNSVS